MKTLFCSRFSNNLFCSGRSSNFFYNCGFFFCGNLFFSHFYSFGFNFVLCKRRLNHSNV